jgi:peptidoglycan/LPS O-acetylase OafA/YrhL
MSASTADLPDGGRQRVTLGQEFDPRRNALNAFRLALAMGVILCHSFPLTGRDVPFAPARQLLDQVWVDGFFAISGFLITSSWLRHPRLRDYIAARGLRILPGLWVCLVVTAFAIAPIGVTLQGGSAAKLLLSGAPIEYILKNSAVLAFQFDIGGTPRGVPRPGQWDGSLWTLGWELVCYIAVAGLGVVGLLSRRWLLPAAMALCWSALVLTTVSGGPTLAQNGARFVVMFLAGALLHQGRNVIPARWSLVAVSVVIVLLASLLPDYRLIAAVPLAYAIVVSGALIHNKRLRLSTDLSYGVYIYAFPIQQLLVIGGLGSMNPIAFWAISAPASLPIAALSWFLVEKPAISLKSRLIWRRSAPTGDRQPEQTVSS